MAERPFDVSYSDVVAGEVVDEMSNLHHAASLGHSLLQQSLHYSVAITMSPFSSMPATSYHFLQTAPL